MESLWGRWQHVGLVLHTPQHDKRAPTRTCILQGHGEESERSVMHGPFDVRMTSISIQTTGKESTNSMRSKLPKQPRENNLTRVPEGARCKVSSQMTTVCSTACKHTLTKHI